jgi:hypothetical protein
MTLRRDALPWLLSAACCFMATAGVVVADQNVQIYYVVAAVLIARAVVGVRKDQFLGMDMRERPGLAPLIAFGFWTVLVTAASPFVFASTPVLNPRDGIDDGVAHPALLTYQISNFAQSGYLIFGIALVAVLGSIKGLSPRLPAAGLALGTVLSSLRTLLPESVAEDLFDNSPNVSYTTGSLNGVERMRGIFSEPSSLGGFEVTAAVFFVMMASRTRGHERYLCLGLAAWALVNAVLSGSGTALIGGMLILAVIAGHALYSYGVGNSRVSAPAFVASILAVPTLIVVGPTLYLSAAGVVGDKVGSSSYANRSTANLFSIDLTWQTYGVGVGVGANRPSSFAATLLSCTGVLGTALYAFAFVVILAGAVRVHRFQPAAWALVSLMFSKLVAGPDLSDPTMWFLLAICANAAWHRRSAASPEARTALSPLCAAADPTAVR